MDRSRDLVQSMVYIPKIRFLRYGGDQGSRRDCRIRIPQYATAHHQAVDGWIVASDRNDASAMQWRIGSPIVGQGQKARLTARATARVPAPPPRRVARRCCARPWSAP